MKTQITGPHGRETYIADFGDGLVMKRPLPEFTQQQKDKWLVKQHRTKEVIEEIRAVGNPVYNIPAMVHIKDDEYQLLEERAPGEPLTMDLYRELSDRQRVEIVNSISSFLVDMNELKPVMPEVSHKMSQELKWEKFENIINCKMPQWFDIQEIKYMESIKVAVENFEYTTRKAWSHADLNSGNVLYDKNTSKIYFIDFAEASYNFIFRDIFSPISIDLGISKSVYKLYTQLHNKDLYRMPGIKSPELSNIMKYRMITALLKRFIKAGDDLRLNPQSPKTIQGNIDKIKFMRDVIAQIQGIEQQFAK